jgi:hypothetical protein
MANTTLFAPQVRAVQPAFTDTVAKIYFSVPYNASYSYVKYQMRDPSLSSASGANLIKEGTISSLTDAITGERYIQITTLGQLTNDKIYQIQIKIGQASSGKESSWSQVTLIKKVEACSIAIDNEGVLPPYDNLELTGSVYFNADATNGPMLQNCSFVDNDSNISTQGYVTGSQFYIPLQKYFLNSNSISGKITIETVDGLQLESSRTLTLGSVGSGQSTLNVVLDKAVGGARITNIPTNTHFLLRKADDSQLWIAIGQIDTNSSWLDYLAEGGKFYSYAAVSSLDNYTTPLATGQLKNLDHEICESEFEDMFLSDSDMMIAIRFNPSISGVKYITQEAITNTLGGKYPIIRKNGDTKYKQFTISGALYLDYYVNELIDCSNKDSISYSFTNDVWYSDEGSLFLSTSNRLNELKNYSNKAIEKVLRQKAEEFLTNGKPKIFRSYEEGPMIVYLNNISFTPNKQLGHHIYDFSAQVNEICDFSSNALNKYGLNTAPLSQFFIDKTQES